MSVERAFFERLALAAPELRALQAEHEACYEELVGHVLIGDICGWACQHLHTDPVAVDAVLAEMARSLGAGDDSVSNMIAVSFLEGLGRSRSRPDEKELRRRLPPALRDELERMEAWHHPSSISVLFRRLLSYLRKRGRRST